MYITVRIWGLSLFIAKKSINEEIKKQTYFLQYSLLLLEMYFAVSNINYLKSYEWFPSKVIENFEGHFCLDIEFDSVVKRKTALLCSDFCGKPFLHSCN